MSAHDIPLPALFAAFGATAVLAWLAAARRRGAAFIATGLLGLQAALHVTFGAGRPHHHEHGTAHGTLHGHGGTTPGAVSHEPASLPEPASLLDALGLDAVGLDAVGLGGASAGMLAAHLLAAGACALWLARGEAAFFRIAHAVGALAFTPLRLLLALVRLPEAPRPPRGARPRPARRHHGVVLAHSLSRRGPPALAVPRATAPGAAHV
ncbi:hypothetical protein ACIRNI_10360 [Streptomyces sp. NPDC093546]|uniref:hypothetical protein n=1 Tax=Streptomyces sp. NPDC093546 TaxID=3366040 RepID=UPI0038162DD9